MIDTVLILAGGLGTRLRTVVSEVPKPLAPINGIPFLDLQIRYLSERNFRRVVICGGYLYEKLSAYYENKKLHVDLVLQNECIPLGTGGAIRKFLTENVIESKYLAVTNGDTFFDFEPLSLQALADRHNATCAISLCHKEGDRFGHVEICDDGKISNFSEDCSNFGLINAGAYVIECQNFLEATAKLGTSFSLERDVFPSLVNGGQVCGQIQTGVFFDIGTPDDYRDFCEFAKLYLQ